MINTLTDEPMSTWELDLSERDYYPSRFLPSTFGVDPNNVTGHTGYTNHFLHSGYWNPDKDSLIEKGVLSVPIYYNSPENPIQVKVPNMTIGTGPFDVPESSGTIDAAWDAFMNKWNQFGIDMRNFGIGFDELGEGIAQVGEDLTNPIPTLVKTALPSWAPYAAIGGGILFLLVLLKK